MSWICPHCNTAAVVDGDDFERAELDLYSGRQLHRYTFVGITCPNPSCMKVILSMKTYQLNNRGGLLTVNPVTLSVMDIIPSYKKERARSYPDYVPASILEDYREACAIADLSPKASATLARRCLQGMIREFWKVEADTLNKEILAIQDKVDPVVWDAIDSVRKVGNIGAHMEKNINVIVDVSPDEADLLIEMIEMLIEDWYIARHQKQEKLRRIKEVAAEKAAARKVKHDEKVDNS